MEMSVSTFTGPDGGRQTGGTRPSLPRMGLDAAPLVRQDIHAATICRRLKDGRPWYVSDAAGSAEPDRIERWLTEFWQKHFPKTPPLITAYWGWEKIDSWVTPDYFPLYPFDEQFTRLVARTRELAATPGRRVSLDADLQKRGDGSFEWDDRERFDKIARKHAVHDRDGQLYLRTPSWLHGGSTASTCVAATLGHAAGGTRTPACRWPGAAAR